MKSSYTGLLATLFFFCLAVPALWAQNPVPGAPQAEKIAIINATIHVGNGQVIENGQILFSAGKIESVAGPTKRAFPDYKVIDAKDKHIYPGLIALNTGLGLTEIGAVRATKDDREVGSMNPNVRAMIAYNTDSQIIPTVRSRGVLLAQTVPTGGTISGKSSVMQLDAWNFEDAVKAEDEGMHFNWPWRQRYSWWTGTVRTNDKYDQEIEELNIFLRQAKAYCAAGRSGATQLKLAAMCDVFKGKTKAYFHVDEARDIQAVVTLAKEHGMKPVIVGGTEAYLVADFLKKEGVTVVLSSTQALPSGEDEDIDQAFKAPAQLAAAGVPFVISHGGYWEQRNLPFVVGTAIAYGLNYEKALQAVTLDAARLTGIDQQYGSLEAGKSATLIIVGGDLFDMRQSEVEHAFIDGRQVDLDNKQAFLNRKFREKYKQKE